MLRASEIPRQAASGRWQTILGRYEPAALADVAETAVTDRADTKFILHDEMLMSVLRSLGDDYRVLDIDGSRFTTYDTQYFDTTDLLLFRRHHAGGGNRYKLRTRHYRNTGLSFLEIKRKTRTGATRKQRIELPRFETRSLQDYAAFVASGCDRSATEFGPVLSNSFDRICLISCDRPERLTIDLDVVFESGNRESGMPTIAVAELKQERTGSERRDSGFLEAMRAHGMRPTAFSKYCIGLLLTRPEIKHNLFNPQLRQLRRLMGEPNAFV